MRLICKCANPDKQDAGILIHSPYSKIYINFKSASYAIFKKMFDYLRINKIYTIFVLLIIAV